MPLAPPVMQLHFRKSASQIFFASPPTPEQPDFAQANPYISSPGGTRNPPVLLSPEMVCSVRQHSLSGNSGRKRYNTLDFAYKVVCHETAGFIGFFLPRRACPPLDASRQGSVSPLDPPANRALSPLLETQTQRNLPSLWNPSSF